MGNWAPNPFWEGLGSPGFSLQGTDGAQVTLGQQRSSSAIMDGMKSVLQVSLCPLLWWSQSQRGQTQADKSFLPSWPGGPLCIPGHLCDTDGHGADQQHWGRIWGLQKELEICLLFPLPAQLQGSWGNGYLGLWMCPGESMS